MAVYDINTYNLSHSVMQFSENLEKINKNQVKTQVHATENPKSCQCLL